jgi:hypothetical protein
MKPLTKRVLTLAALLAVPLFVAVQVRADTIVIHDLTDTASVTQTGTSTTVSAIPCPPSNPCTGEDSYFTIAAPTALGGPNAITAFTDYAGHTYTLTPPTPFSAGYALTESGDLTAVSDEIDFELDSGTGLATILFSSDSENPLALCNGVNCIEPETGLPQTLGVITWADGTTATVQVQSDINDVVPEPSSLLLFGTGLIGVAGTLKRKLLS